MFPLAATLPFFTTMVCRVAEQRALILINSIMKSWRLFVAGKTRIATQKELTKKKIYTLKSSRHYVIVEYGSFCLFWRRLCIHTLMVGMGERKFILSFRLFLSSYSRRDFPSSN